MSEAHILNQENKAPNAYAGAWYSLLVLTIVYVLNFLDRTIIYILFSPIKKEMLLSDVELALLGTTSFVLFYTALGIPFGKLADTYSRKTIIAIGLVIWSLFSGLTGFAYNFWTLFLCRVFVGIGEATLGPAALSLISDLFPPNKRATVQAIYNSGIPIGAGLAFFLGGYLGQEMGWRWAFYLLGFPGILIALLVFFLKEPERGSTERRSATPDTQSSTPHSWRDLLAIKTLRFHHIGYAMFAVAANALSIWMPSYFNRALGYKLADIGFISGIGMITIGSVGVIAGGWFADKLNTTYKGGRMKAIAYIAVACIPLWIVLLLSQNSTLLFASYILLLGLGLSWMGAAAADVHDIVGPNLRGLATGVYFFTVNIIGYGLAPLIMGKVNDAVGTTQIPTNMVYSLILCPVACAITAAALTMGSRTLHKQYSSISAEVSA